MALSTVFQLSVYSLAAMSGLILAIAEGSALPAGATLPLAILTLVFVEHRRLLHLSTGWANACGVLAFVAAAAEFFGDNLEGRLLSGAHLLVYLSWIVLVQRKGLRQYWWMCALGVLQVAVASVLLDSGLFGTLLIAYVLLAIWTLSVFSIYQAEMQFASTEHYVVAPAETPGRVAALSAAATTGTFSDMTRGSIQLDPNERWINGRFMLGVLTTAVLSMSMGMVFYLLIPRLWVGQLPFSTSRAIAGRAVTGFSEDVRLGDMGEILESNEPVMEVRLVNERNGERVDIEAYSRRLGYEEPLFRGAVLNEYQNGRWSHAMLPFDQRVLRPMPDVPRRNSPIRQSIKLYPVSSRVVFAIHPVTACRLEEPANRMRIDPATAVMMLPRRARIDGGVVHYSAFAADPWEGEVAGPELSSGVWYDPRGRFRPYLHFPRSRLERMEQKAQEVAQFDPGGEPTLSEQEMVDRLVAYLRDSGEFSYSLDTSITDSSVDPVEDFLFNRRSGHCEYYASAMALMLRSVGIPSRLITGFKGGVKNQINDTYIVEQRHAHAWVEAYLDDRWVTLDAVPAGRDQSVQQLDPAVPTWRDIKQVLTSLWSERVAMLNYGQQELLFYDPIRRLFVGVWAKLREAVERGLGAGRSWITSPETWFSWRGWIAAFVFLWVVLLLFRGFAYLLKRLWTWRHNWRTTRRLSRTRVDFYERFQQILRPHGFQREPSQTQREFAISVVERLQSRLAAQGLDEFPPELVQSFYGVRFGGQSLSPDEARGIDDALDRLTACLALKSDAPTASNGSGRAAAPIAAKQSGGNS